MSQEAEMESACPGFSVSFPLLVSLAPSPWNGAIHIQSSGYALTDIPRRDISHPLPLWLEIEAELFQAPAQVQPV